MTNLKQLTWEEHKNAERQAFVKELMGGISVQRYCDFLHNLHPQYNILENFSKLHNLLDIEVAKNIHADILELEQQLVDYKPVIYPVVKEYTDHLLTIKDDPHKLMAHIYVRHMGDLSGGQMIAKRIPGSAKFYQFDEDVNVLKDKIRTRLDDSMADEAKICFNFATELFKQMAVSNN